MTPLRRPRHVGTLLQTASMAAEADPQKRAPIVHPKPTDAVVKELYGTAFRCGKPDCQRPLYRLNDETGEAVLNSQVAHIHARSEGGPRWKDGMSADDNRSATNLIPLCLEHAFEIDQKPELFPADLLRDWKAGQLAEFKALHKSWPLTDDEADEVRSQSFGAREHGHAAAASQTVMSAMTEVGGLLEAAPTARRVPAAVAAEWRRRHAEANATTIAYDMDGERLQVELPYGERRELRARMEQALAEAGGRVEPRVAAVNGLVHALSPDVALAPWCEWLRTATGAVLAASFRWPADGLEDDGVLAEALDGLRRASVALGRAARGRTAEAPPEPAPEPTPPAESDEQRRLRLHQEALAAARPWRRVDHRPYDPNVYSTLETAASFALLLPPTPGLYPWALDATARLASSVARNADDSALRSLIDRAGQAEPVAVAAALLRNLEDVARETSRETEQALAKALLRDRLEAQAWDNEAAWRDNGAYCRESLHWTAHVVGAEHVRARLTAALTARPSLVREVLAGVAQWMESRDFESGAFLGVKSGVRDVPEWLPTELLVAAIRSELHGVVARDLDAVGEPTPEHLAAQLLWEVDIRARQP